MAASLVGRRKPGSVRAVWGYRGINLVIAREGHGVFELQRGKHVAGMSSKNKKRRKEEKGELEK